MPLQYPGHAAPKAVLYLEDGTLYEGFAHGAPGTFFGELCFNTGLTGYQEIFTDPSYFGQLVITTHVHIGNYGVVGETESESTSVKIAGLICKGFTNVYSRADAESSLHTYLMKNGVMAISGLDTRALVLHLRAKGAMNGIISSELFDPKALAQKLSECPSMQGLSLYRQVGTQQLYDVNEGGSLKVAALDLGVKTNILRSLAERGCHIRVFPAQTPFAEIAAWQPNGYFISNGPGDPAAMPEVVETVKSMVESNTPTFGICMGHQMMALAMGVPTYKMPYGHRGLNHPVKNLKTGLSEITSQNHGFAVDADKAAKHPRLELTHVNLNDKTLEGFRLKDRPAFAVQYHPESNPGPHDSHYLFDDFVQLMRGQ